MKTQHSNPFRTGLAAATFTLLAAGPLWAGNTWDGGAFGGDNWTFPLNWDGDAVPDYTTAITFAGNVRNTPFNDRLVNSTINGINFTNNGSVGNTNAFTLSGNSITLGGNIITTANTAGSTITDEISMDMILSGNRTITTNHQNSSVQHNLIISGDISESGTRNLTKNGSGQLTLTGSNSFSGLLTIVIGTLNANSIADSTVNSALGKGSTIRIGTSGATGTLNLTAGATSTNRQILIGDNTAANTGGARINNNTTNGAGTLVFTHANFNSLNTSVTAARTLTLGGANTDANEIQGIIADNSASGTIGVTKVDAGTWVLSGSNSSPGGYTGATQVNGGILVFGKTAAKASGTVTAAAAGSVGLGVGGAGFYSATNVADLFNTNTLTGFSLNSASGVAIDTSAGDFDQNVALTGDRSLTKLGSNTLTLSQTNSYTGETNVTTGTLLINGNISTSTLTTVNNGGTLGGTGTVGALTVASGGTLAPGNSPGILNSGDLNLNAGGTLAIELNGTTAGVGGYDQMNVTGSVTLAGLLSLTAGFTPTVGDLFFIVKNDLSDAVSGTFSNANYTDTEVFTLGGMDWRISYAANAEGTSFTGGNDVALMAVPEPNAAALLGSLGVLMLLRRRR